MRNLFILKFCPAKRHQSLIGRIRFHLIIGKEDRKKLLSMGSGQRFPENHKILLKLFGRNFNHTFTKSRQDISFHIHITAADQAGIAFLRIQSAFDGCNIFLCHILPLFIESGSHPAAHTAK